MDAHPPIWNAIPGTTRKYTVLHPLVLSFFSKEFYRDVAQSWRGISFAYLFFLLALAWMPFGLKVHEGSRQFATGPGAALVAQIPAITITDGIVAVDAEQPYYITDPTSHKVVAVLDTTGKVTELGDTSVVLLVTRDHAMIRQSAQESRTYNLSKIALLSIDRDRVARWLRLATTWAAPALYAVLLLFSYLFRVVQALIFAVVGIPLAKHCGAVLSYWSLASIAVMSLTPVIIVRTLMEAGGVSFPFSWLVFSGVALMYLGYGIKASAVSKEGGAPGESK